MRVVLNYHKKYHEKANTFKSPKNRFHCLGKSNFFISSFDFGVKYDQGMFLTGFMRYISSQAGSEVL